MPVVRATGLVKTFGEGRATRRVLDGAELSVEPGEVVAILGRSGTGKSTLLHLLGGLDRPEAVRVRLLLDGEPQHEGDASAVLGDPLESLRWLGAKRPLRAGDWVATGAITRACRLAIGDAVSADFGALGRVSIRR